MARDEVIPISLSGEAILHSSLLNKGTAFAQEERDLLGLNGLLPFHISSIEEQIARIYQNFQNKRSSLAKYEFLINLLGHNELLFHQFISRYAVEMLPIIYTPTVGEAATQYSRTYFQQRGLYLSYPLRDKMDDILNHAPAKGVQVIVATDGERILGLGDQGIGGMTIPIGKVCLYTLFGGIHPSKTLPIFLDVGTNHPDLLKDPLYLGWRHHRVEGAEYDAFIDRFVQAVAQRFPHALLQWEDFGKNNARRLLDQYRNKVLSFNDDIQGTAAVVLGALLAAIQEIDKSLINHRFAILGGGSAGTGIADILVLALCEEGLSLEEARQRIYLIDIDGLIHFNTPHVSEGQRPYIKPQSVLKNWAIANATSISLLDVIRNAHPTVLIGTSAQQGAFSRDIAMEMLRYTKRPIIFPLSNPVSKAECTPQELIEWTEGQAIIATGSPFQPVSYKGKTYTIAQCNNVYIFSGVGMGAIASRAKWATDEMFLEAARKLAAHSPMLKDPTAPLLPPISDVRRVSREIAIAVGKKAIQEKISPIPLEKIEKEIDSIIWEPKYPRYILKNSSGLE